MKINDRVVIENPDLKSHGMTGVVEDINCVGSLLVLREDGVSITVKLSNVRLLEQTPSFKKKSGKSVIIFTTSDDIIPMNMKDISIEEFMKATGLEGGGRDWLYGEKDEILKDLEDELGNWERVYGLCDNKPFLIKKDITIEGLEE